MQAEDDAAPPSWRQRPKPIGFEIAYRLDGDTLEIDSTRKVDRVRLAAVEQVRFVYAPSNVTAKSFRTQLRLSDGKSITFKLKDGAKFASGNPVRPEDVIYSFVRATKLGKTPVFIVQELGWTPDNIASLVTKVDDTHVKVGWAADVGASFALAILTAPIASIVDEKLVASHVAGDDFGNAWLKTNSAGSGPFVIKSYTPHESLVLQANPTSPAGAPKMSTVIFKNVADAAARRLLIEQGDVDMARDLGADQIASLKGKPGIVVQDRKSVV